MKKFLNLVLLKSKLKTTFKMFEIVANWIKYFYKGILSKNEL
jgi:hypothetical protein